MGGIVLYIMSTPLPGQVGVAFRIQRQATDGLLESHRSVRLDGWHEEWQDIEQAAVGAGVRYGGFVLQGRQNSEVLLPESLIYRVLLLPLMVRKYFQEGTFVPDFSVRLGLVLGVRKVYNLYESLIS